MNVLTQKKIPRQWVGTVAIAREVEPTSGKNEAFLSLCLALG